jgi:7-cyano-7-deazaguanine synthase
MRQKKSITNSLIILSGGMDSVTMLYDYRRAIKEALVFNYGSKHNEKEILFAKLHAQRLGIPCSVIELDWINSMFRSALLQSGDEIPEGHYEDKIMEKTIVPFRNGIMLSIAVGVAESHELDCVMIGSHAGDRAIYPDCRREFLSAFASSARLGTIRKVGISAPYIDMTKREIALIGRSIEVDYTETWTCYKGEESHCGKCGSCVERKEALEGFDETYYQEF